MSQNDLYSPDSGNLQPYQPGGVDLYTPSAEDAWGVEPDYLSERQLQPLPQNVEQNFQNIADCFTNDMAGLGFVQKDIDKCIGWFRQSLTNPPQRMPAKKHNYNLWQYSNDAAMNAFANYAATQKFSQNLIQSICFWLQSFEDLQNGVGRFAHLKQQAPTTSSDPTANLSNADYDRVVAINDAAAAATLGYLQDLWGSSYAANLKVTQEYFSKLPAADQEYLNQYAQNWVRGTNDAHVLLGLYRSAIGAGSLPKSGADIGREIASIENVMRTERAKYMRDDQLQARYRELLRMRGY